ncbi:MAG: hypothetical protein U0525_05090 [Patescibacteria group bacterium]
MLVDSHNPLNDRILYGADIFGARGSLESTSEKPYRFVEGLPVYKGWHGRGNGVFYVQDLGSAGCIAKIDQMGTVKLSCGSVVQRNPLNIVSNGNDGFTIHS